MMRIAISRVVLLFTGLALLLAALLAALAGPVGAAPAMVITETPTTEPPTRTSTSTTVPPANTATATSTSIPPGSTATATSTSIPPGSTATATSVPPTDVPDDDDDQGEGQAPTSAPEATPIPAMTPITQIADPAITKSASVSTAQVGDTVEFSITVTNLGNATAGDVVVEDSLPAFLALDGVSATRGDVSVSGNTVRVVIGDLAPGEEVTVTITTRVIASAAPPNNSNVATVSTSSVTDDPSNNSSSVSLNIAQPTPTAAPPVSLPNTGSPGDPALPALLVLGLLLISLSLIARRRQA